MAEFYVWVFPPSAVRDGFQVGAYARDIDAKIELDFSIGEYDAPQAAELLWHAVVAAHPSAPTFYSARSIDAPLSAALRDTLIAKAAGSPA